VSEADIVLRQARSDDRVALSHICLRTGAAGEDATAREDDPELIGLIYAVPYLELEPDFAIVAEGPSGVMGYVLGALDTARFNVRLDAEWFAPLRERIGPAPADPATWHGSDWARHHIHHPPADPATVLARYPSHAHIDLLPEIQRRGMGRRLLTCLEARLTDAGSPGLHLALAPENQRALLFYKALGYTELPEAPAGALYVGKRLGGRGPVACRSRTGHIGSAGLALAQQLPCPRLQRAAFSKIN